MTDLSAMYLWASVGTADDPPERVKVEACTDCGALVPVEGFDKHGQWHRDMG